MKVDTAWQQLLAQYQQKRLPHAILLSGQSSGEKKEKQELAVLLAKLVLCEQSDEQQYTAACGSCHSCKLFLAGNHPDFFQIHPEEKSKIIKIDAIRELTAALSHTAQLNGYQVVIIYPAENMNTAAANALLKTLEEPVGAVLFILITDHGQLPITILSRCQKIFISNTFSDGGGLITDKLLRDKLLTHLLAIYQDHKNPIDEKIIKEFLQSDIKNLLQIFLVIIIDILRLQLNPVSEEVINHDQILLLKKLNYYISRATVLMLLEKLMEALKIIQSAVSINTNLLLEGVLLHAR